MKESMFDVSLRELKELLLRMSDLVERSIEIATTALEQQDPHSVHKVFSLEKQINQCHLMVDAQCLNLLALQQPLAKDLRLIVAIIKINTDLERMGDQAVNIATNTERYLKQPPIKPLVDLPCMFAEVRAMVRETFTCFVQNDVALARSVVKRDDRVDALKHKIFLDTLEVIKSDPAKIEQGLSLILVARNLERLGDHATNIAEDVIFAVTGEDIRHAPRVETMIY